MTDRTTKLADRNDRQASKKKSKKKKKTEKRDRG